MASFNRVILAGNLTRDPQLSYTPGNVAVVEFGMAMNRKFRDKDGQSREEVCFVDVTAYGRTAETINQYFQKGRSILIEGRLRWREWTNKEGQKRSRLDVLAESFAFIDSGGSGGGGGGRGPAPSGGGGGGYGGRQQSRPEQPMPEAPDDMPPPSDADIPF